MNSVPEDTIEEITKEDIEQIYTPTSLRHIVNMIHPKIRTAFPPGSQSSIIDCELYPRVLLTSDIHADFPKFMELLQQLGLIAPRPLDNIYDPTLISDVQWTGGSNTLFVIIGDIVGGKSATGKEVNDPKGTFELLLFLLIHNLRLQARTMGSDIRYTLGEHEVNDYYADENHNRFYDQFVHDSAKQFLKNQEMRRNIMMPFLMASPSLLLRFLIGGRPELVCVHGSLHSAEGKGLEEALFVYQTDPRNGLDKATTPARFRELLQMRAANLAILSRYYAEKDDPAVCDLLRTSEYPLTVVGHCSTISRDMNRPYERMLENPRLYDGCDHRGTIGRGCIVTDCVTSANSPNKGAPTLVMVDAGLSTIFRTGGDTEQQYRKVEVLELKHDPTLQKGRYYNIMNATTGSQTRTLYKASAAEDVFPRIKREFSPMPFRMNGKNARKNVGKNAGNNVRSSRASSITDPLPPSIVNARSSRASSITDPPPSSIVNARSRAPSVANNPGNGTRRANRVKFMLTGKGGKRRSTRRLRTRKSRN
jgi:hypothetical protein